MLFEIFTGRRALRRARRSTTCSDFTRPATLTMPSSIVRDLDPAVERVILRCLEQDPDRRPASALVVAAALARARDPLAAALAAGETPSPEMLAAAGEAAALGVGRGARRGRRPSPSGLLTFASLLSRRRRSSSRVPIRQTRRGCWSTRPMLSWHRSATPSAIVDRVFRFVQADDYVEWIRGSRRDPNRWERLPTGTPSAVRFWYRTQSPRYAAAGAAVR